MTDVINGTQFDFGDSPFVDDVVVNGGGYNNVAYMGGMNTVIEPKGGYIKSGDSAVKYVLIGLLIIVIIYLFYRIVMHFQHGGEDYYQRKTHHHFENIHGEAYDNEAKQTIEFGEAIPNPRAIDHYRVGTVLLVNAREPQRAHRHFRQALEQVINGEVDTKEAPYIINRIDDFKDHFFDFPDIEELPIQNALMAFIEQQRKQVSDVVRKKETVAPDDPQFLQKVLVNRQEWHSDSQNVHDSAMYTMLANQYNKTRSENLSLKNIGQHDYNDAVQWLKTRYAQDAGMMQKIEQALKMIGRNEPVGCIPHANEKDILTTVWQRSYDPDNKDNAIVIREALADALADCIEGGSTVCMSGRTKKVWQALARLDKDPENGVLKSKEAIRNEIYQKSAKIVDDFIGENGSASDALKEAYRKSDDTQQVKELVETIHKQIDDLRKDYKNFLPDEQLDVIVKECQAVVS